jgi:hypothetical protein
MNQLETFVVGIAPMHLPALLAAMLLPILVLVVRRLRSPIMSGQVPPATGPGLPVAPAPAAVGSTAQLPAAAPRTVRIWMAWLLGIAAAVHLALPLGHFDGVLLTMGYVGSGAAYAWLALRAYEGRTYRLWSALLLSATLLAYLIVSLAGGEEPDQIGIATALVELLALGLCLVAAREPGRPRRFKRFAGSSATIVITFVVGVSIWAGTIAAHAATDSDVSANPEDGGVAVGGHDDEHAHEHAARAQAGIILRPQADHHPTAEQVAAAQALADATMAGTTRYARLQDAIDAGYVLPANAKGTDVHMENPKFKQDGQVLNPERPETLVYAIEGGRATLLGVVYVMERAGVPAPQPGGPITRWHAHNLCLTALLPGFGIVSPFGTCPQLSLNLTTPEMMHVWVVGNPTGPFAEGLDAEWTREYHAEHGLPIG